MAEDALWRNPGAGRGRCLPASLVHGSQRPPEVRVQKWVAWFEFLQKSGENPKISWFVIVYHHSPIEMDTTWGKSTISGPRRKMEPQSTSQLQLKFMHSKCFPCPIFGFHFTKLIHWGIGWTARNHHPMSHALQLFALLWSSRKGASVGRPQLSSLNRLGESFGG